MYRSRKLMYPVFDMLNHAEGCPNYVQMDEGVSCTCARAWGGLLAALRRSARLPLAAHAGCMLRRVQQC
jgi:hypothetical protein